MPTIAELEPLLTAPTEALDVEYKGWLDLKANDEHKGLFAKAAIAIANEGGGYIVIGLREVRPNLISEPRPSTIAPYDQDLINQIVRRFATPSFHCTLTILSHSETNVEHAVISVPGGFGFPVMSKSGTPQASIKPHLCYMRKPGPESAPPETPSDWDSLLKKCLRNQREDMLDAIRAIVEGKTIALLPQATSELAQKEPQKPFAQAARVRWTSLTSSLDPQAPQRCPFGRFEFDYALLGEFDPPSLSNLLDVLSRAVVRYTGWPEFWVPTRVGIEPVPIDDMIECWIGAPTPDRRFNDSAHADFWRASADGRMFLLRGYSEDSGLEPGKTFDISMPTWRIGECLIHASRLAALLAPASTLRVLFRARWYGLRDRRLAAMSGDRIIDESYVCRQDDYSTETTVDVARIAENLPEIIYPLLAPLYERFGFFRLPLSLPAEEIAKMRARRI